MSFGIPPNGGDWSNYLKQREAQKTAEVPCLHKACTRCQGTGQDRFGRFCIHAISCPCKNCSWIA